MKTLMIQLTVAASLLAPLALVYAQQPDEESKDIEKVLRSYFAAISNRDASALRNVLGRRFVAMDAVTEAGNKNARVEVLDTADDTQLLPPEGNNDMVGLQVTSVTAQYSHSNPTVAMASFVVSRPLTEVELERFSVFLGHLKQTTGDPSRPAVDPSGIEKMLSGKQLHHSMFAMLGRQDGEWKIICMSFPE